MRQHLLDVESRAEALCSSPELLKGLPKKYSIQPDIETLESGAQEPEDKDNFTGEADSVRRSKAAVTENKDEKDTNDPRIW